MKLNLQLTAAGTLVAALAMCGATELCAAQGSTGPQDVATADKPITYTFRQELANSMGLKSIEELRGKPVLIEFWGTR